VTARIFSGTRFRCYELKSVAARRTAIVHLFSRNVTCRSLVYARHMLRKRILIILCVNNLLSRPPISAHPVYRSATWLFPLPYRGTFRHRISTRRGFYLTFTRSTSSLNRFWRPYAMGREYFSLWTIFFIMWRWRETQFLSSNLAFPTTASRIKNSFLIILRRTKRKNEREGWFYF